MPLSLLPSRFRLQARSLPPRFITDGSTHCVPGGSAKVPLPDIRVGHSERVTSAFRRVAPQVIEHVEGWRVQIADRFHVEYVNGPDVVRVDAGLDGPVVRLHP